LSVRPDENSPLAESQSRLEGFLHDFDRKWLRRRLFLWRATGGDLKRVWRIDQMSRRAILIGGCGRSGTTVLQGLLSCHTEVVAVDVETSAFCRTAYMGQVDLQSPFELERVYRRLVMVSIPPAANRWSEKTPKNVLYARRALRYLGPRARFIHIVRDGRDVVTSKHFRAPDRYWVAPERWIHDVGAGRKLEGNPRVHTLRYEDLVRRLEPTLRDLCAFLDMPFDRKMLEYPDTATVNRLDGWEPRLRPISAASIGRWEHPEHREAVEALMAHPQAAGLLDHYGYLNGS